MKKKPVLARRANGHVPPSHSDSSDGEVELDETCDFFGSVRSSRTKTPVVVAHPKPATFVTSVDEKIASVIAARKKAKSQNEFRQDSGSESGIPENSGDDEEMDVSSEEGSIDSNNDEADESLELDVEGDSDGDDSPGKGEIDEEGDVDAPEDPVTVKTNDVALEKVELVIEKPSPKEIKLTDGTGELVKGMTRKVEWQSLGLHRTLLKAVNALNWECPTAVQEKAIGPILKGEDVLVCSLTGSGKTGAFVLPILQKLLYRNRRNLQTSTLIVVPTRELASQVHEMVQEMAKFVGELRFALVVGGISLKPQELALRSRPDIVIATPGRVIDHLRNSPDVHFDDLEMLVLDEADRLLELGFTAELTELLKYLPKRRQTMLFSATLTDRISHLASLSLQSPRYLAVDEVYDVSPLLVQQFVRVRDNNNRLPVLLALLLRSFSTGTVVFFATKKLVHRAKVILGLLGIKSAELHGNLTQAQRLAALDAFTKGAADHLLVTDLAARGLDLRAVTTVINCEMPQTLRQYVHRVGRTARAGQKGIAVSLVNEPERSLVKKIVKHSKTTLQHRVVPTDIVSDCRRMIETISGEVGMVMRAEREDAELARAEQEAQKGQNLLEHAVEIRSRPARTWFQSEREKRALKSDSRVSQELDGVDEEALERPNRKERKRKREADGSTKKKKKPKTRNEKKRAAAAEVALPAVALRRIVRNAKSSEQALKKEGKRPGNAPRQKQKAEKAPRQKQKAGKAPRQKQKSAWRR